MKPLSNILLLISLHLLMIMKLDRVVMASKDDQTPQVSRADWTEPRQWLEIYARMVVLQTRTLQTVTFLMLQMINILKVIWHLVTLLIPIERQYLRNLTEIMTGDLDRSKLKFTFQKNADESKWRFICPRSLCSLWRYSFQNLILSCQI